MTKLWAFGDSFTVGLHLKADSDKRRADHGMYPPFQELENNWIGTVSEKISGSVDYENYAVAGCSNEYIFHTLMENASKFKKGDCVIVTFTANNRRWLVERCLHLANWSNCKFTPDMPDSVTKAEATAIE